MGLFFDTEPSQDQVDILSEAYQRQPAPPGELDHLVGQYLRQLGGSQVSAVTAALQNQALEPQRAQARARAALAQPTPRPPARFRPLRFTIAVLIFATLTGAGIWADALHLSAATSALFSFAGSVLGVVTAFLGAEKGA
jgi:hypothetical protein